MDSANISPEALQQLQNMSAKDKQELNQFIQGENQKAQIQGVVHSLTDTYAFPSNLSPRSKLTYLLAASASASPARSLPASLIATNSLVYKTALTASWMPT